MAVADREQAAHFDFFAGFAFFAFFGHGPGLREDDGAGPVGGVGARRQRQRQQAEDGDEDGADDFAS